MDVGFLDGFGRAKSVVNPNIYIVLPVFRVMTYCLSIFQICWFVVWFLLCNSLTLSGVYEDTI